MLDCYTALTECSSAEASRMQSDNIKQKPGEWRGKKKYAVSSKVVRCAMLCFLKIVWWWILMANYSRGPFLSRDMMVIYRRVISRLTLLYWIILSRWKHRSSSSFVTLWWMWLQIKLVPMVILWLCSSLVTKYKIAALGASVNIHCANVNPW